MDIEETGESMAEMDDGGVADFLTSLEAKLGASPEETTPVEPEPVDDGEVIAEEPTEVEEVAETEPAEEEVTLIGGKFKSQDDLLKAYEEAQRKLGEQGSELGELRRLREEFEEFASSFEEDEPAQMSPHEVAAYSDQIQENPSQVAVWALQNGHDLLYDSAIRQLYDIGDIFTANRLEQARMMAAMQAQVRQTIEPLEQPVQRMTQNQEFNQAWRAVAEKMPDLNKFADAIQEAATTAPEVVGALRQGDMASKERVIENLYWLAKGRQAETFQEAAKEVARQTAEDNQRAKAEATVASASSSPTRGDTGKTWKDDLKESIMSAASENSLMDGFGKD